MSEVAELVCIARSLDAAFDIWDVDEWIPCAAMETKPGTCLGDEFIIHCLRQVLFQCGVMLEKNLDTPE